MRTLLVCSLLVLLSAAVLSENANIEDPYMKFVRQHIYKQMRANMCDKVMQQRGIKIKNKCKKLNTFILADIKQVTAVCVNEGEPNGDMTKSLQHFDIVVCELKNQTGKNPKCQYDGVKLRKKIIIKCGRLPVHYHGDIGHCDN